jgi:RluA family pseudouridine synthase
VPPAVDEPPPELGPERILFRDDALLVVDKPAQLPVRARLTLGGADLVAAARRLVGPDAFVGTPHRLDRDTSGSIALALDRAASAALHRAFLRGEVSKTYLAVVGRAELARGVVDAPILARAGERPRVDPAGRPARTRWRVVRRGASGVLVALRPFAGRTHQLRLHLASIGCPIRGDRVHGGDRGPARTLLHARRLVLPHRGRRLVVRAPLPPDLIAGLDS